MRQRRCLTSAAVLALALAACSDDRSSPNGAEGFDTSSGVFRNGDVPLAYVLDVPRGRGPHPAVVLVHGSGRTTKEQQLFLASRFVERGFAVLRYDKRGVGSSGGVYSGVGIQNSDTMFPLLASDAARAIEHLAAQPRIDQSRLGLVGVSQAGWIIPIAASLAPVTDFAVLLSGPTVSVGIENYYSDLVENNQATLDGVSQKLAAYDGPHGFDPLEHLRRMGQPTLWLFGGKDRSIPTPECVARLEELIAAERKQFAIRVYPFAGHDLGPFIEPDLDAWLEATVLRGRLTR
ncbi:MAG TPA: alpha/beta fold hydrolase [Gemmatimonadaceae bacterium]|nr:alpha/beta fold hydrolase [Gemmatimonadaceae bacterium]